MRFISFVFTPKVDFVGFNLSFELLIISLSVVFEFNNLVFSYIIQVVHIYNHEKFPHLKIFTTFPQCLSVRSGLYQIQLI